jgi:hypothetical protein
MSAKKPFRLTPHGKRAKSLFPARRKNKSFPSFSEPHDAFMLLSLSAFFLRPESGPPRIGFEAE